MTKLFFDRIKTLKSIISSDVKMVNFNQDVKPLLLEPASEIYFYQNISDPAWFDILSNDGIFSLDLQIFSDEKEKYPPLLYLKNVIKESPERVINMILKFPKTSNRWIQESILDIATLAPGTYSIKLIPHFISLIKIPEPSIFPDKFSELIVHLLKEGCEDEAFELANTLLELTPKSANKDGEIFSHTEPQAYYDSWHYNQTLNTILPVFTEKDGIRTLKMVSELLTKAVDLSQHPSPEEDTKAKEDHSTYWCSTIEKPDDFESHEIKGLLVSAVRLVTNRIIELNSEMGKEVLENIEGGKYKIFLRIGLYLRKIWPDIDFPGTEKLVIRPEIVGDKTLHHEFCELINNQFLRFKPETKESYLKIIENGPDLSELSSRTDVDEHTIKKWKEYTYKEWQFKKLWCIQEHLDEYPDWKRRFNQLKEEFKDVKDPDFPIDRSRVMVGPTSSMNIENFQSKSVDEIVSFLKSRMSSTGFMKETPEGRGRVLASYISTEPQKFDVMAEKFKELDPTYVRSYLHGFHDAVRQDKTFEWSQIMNLCSWVMSQTREIQGRTEESFDFDTNWGLTRKAIAELLSAGFGSDTNRIPFSLRSQIWDILKPITDDPDPTSEHEERYGGTNMDPSTLSINTTRGEAMHAVIHYALWVRKHMKTMSGTGAEIVFNFTEAPEAQNVLEDHLNPDIDPSLAIRSVYGRWFPQLAHFLDTEWTKKNISIIFPHEEKLTKLRDAAWETYIQYNQPYDEIVELLWDEYAYAIEHLSPKPDTQDISRYEGRLIEHLILLYCRDKLDFNKDGLLDKFYSRVSDKLSERVLWFLHRILVDNDPISPEIKEKIMKLWENRILKIRDVPEAHKEELASFSWLFASEKLDSEWAIEQLKLVLACTDSKTDVGERRVIKRLAELSKDLPLQSIKAFEMIIDGIENEWIIYSWKDYAKEILENTLNCTDDNAKSIAEQLTHKIGSWGHLEFGDLLKRNNTFG